MPELPDPTRAELAALRAPDLSAAYERTLAHCRAMEHATGRELEMLERGLRYFAGHALPAAGFEIIAELEPPPTSQR